MSRSSAQRKHDLTADACQKALVKLIQSFSHGHHLHSVFSDFVELCALAISNSVDRTQFEVREKRYLDIVGKYKREEVERFPEMLGLLTESLELRVQAMGKAGASGSAMVSGGLTDVLGETYMMLELGNARAGQFFTPYHVSRLMAMMTIGDGGAAVRETGFMRLQEPACGAGGMVIAAAESLHDAGLNYQQAMHATCIDIDPCCVHMAYVQLSLLHIPAIVVHGNALTLDVWGLWYTPAHIMGGWRRKLERRERKALAEILAIAGEQAAESSGEEVAVEVSLSEPQPEADAGADGETAVLDRPVVIDVGTAKDVMPLSESLALHDLFEEIVSSEKPSNSIFEKIDQMSLF
ncbi:hypothetical protein P3T18_001005 [Paraburkholderia sp. GAS199]|uniref:N-6 DNA methylase n=1 Tax=Paraburkholderia sp. GAS199 TaxID=3035126 RepID=UPI003D20F3A0